MSRNSAVGRAAVLATLAVGLAALALPPTLANAGDRAHSQRADLVSRASGHASFASAHGTAGVFFGAARGHAATRPAGISRQDSPAAAAAKWMRSYGAAFGVRDAARDLYVAR